MQPPLPPGIVLQKRYSLLKVLGEGGFGRTYLARDQDCYDELCVIKEYNPSIKGTYALEKSKELFVREAQVLYKIEHPRVPKFRATFEQGKRLFLVQDYVEGQTYRSLLDERIRENRAFTQLEVIEFLQQMLPVLAHIHGKGIIHRDISPDNIIRRRSDRLPVLIDFGAVKEVTCLEGTTGLGSRTIQGTTVGKRGYSPPEQLRTGKIYPNSDLYALAVTAIMLMTGKKPQELFYESVMTWRWHQWVPTLDLWMAQLLNKMLSRVPENRYQSAKQVEQVLRSRVGLMGSAVRPPDGTVLYQQLRDRPRPQTGKAYKIKDSKVGDRPGFLRKVQTWMGQGIYASIILFISLGTVVWFRSLPRQSAQPQSASSEKTPRVSSLPASPRTSTTKPITYEIPLDLWSGQKSDRQTIKARQTYRYRIYGETGQLLNVLLDTEKVGITVSGSDLQPINNRAVLEWKGILPADGTYYIEISPIQQMTESEPFVLTVSLMAAE